MNIENDKWLDALAGKNNSQSDDTELNIAKMTGIRLRNSLEKIVPDEDGLNRLIKRLEDESLLNKNKNLMISSYWRYATAATLLIAISIPVALMQSPTTTYDYPIMRGLVETQKILTANPQKSLQQFQSVLIKRGYKSQVYKRDKNLILVFSINELTPELIKTFGEYSIELKKIGTQHIEFGENTK